MNKVRSLFKVTYKDSRKIFLLLTLNRLYTSFRGLLLNKPAFTCSKLTIETLEQGVKYVQNHWRRSGVFNVNFEHISHLVLRFLLLTLSR